MRILKASLLAAVAALLLVPPASAARHGRDDRQDQGDRHGGLIVYQEDNFGGDSREIREDQPDLGWIHFDDRISSVEVRRGVWELCEHANYRGSCITVDHDVRKLSHLRFDDKTSSIRRVD